VAAAYIVPAAVVVTALSVPLIGYVYGREFVPAVPALFILLVGMGVANLFFWARPALLALHRPEYQMRVALVLVVVKLAGVFILVPLTGYVGSAALAAAIYIPGSAILVWKVREIVAHAQRARTPT
jgi:O-antigen/teichoic acid export membrane protein